MDARESLKGMKIPTLMIVSNNDPIVNNAEYPVNTFYSNPNLMLVRTPRGGHLEFMTGITRKRWYKEVIAQYLHALEEEGQ